MHSSTLDKYNCIDLLKLKLADQYLILFNIWALLNTYTIKLKNWCVIVQSELMWIQLFINWYDVDQCLIYSKVSKCPTMFPSVA